MTWKPQPRTPQLDQAAPILAIKLYVLCADGQTGYSSTSIGEPHFFAYCGVVEIPAQDSLLNKSIFAPRPPWGNPSVVSVGGLAASCRRVPVAGKPGCELRSLGSGEAMKPMTVGSP